MVEMDGGYFRLHNKLVHQIDNGIRNHPNDYQQDANDFLRSYYNLNKTRKVEPLRHHGKLARLQHDQQKNKDHLAQINNGSSSTMNSKLAKTILPPMDYITYEEALQSTNDSMRQLRQSKRKSDQTMINNLLNNTNMQLSLIKPCKQQQQQQQQQQGNQIIKTKTKIRKEYIVKIGSNSNFNSTTTQKREIPLLVEIKSKYKWSKAENQKLNEIYLDNKRNNIPSDLDIWKGYLKNISMQFQAYYPHRELQDILMKLQQMIQLKQMKEQGEAEYWNQLHTMSINTPSSSITATTSTSSSQLERPKPHRIK